MTRAFTGWRGCSAAVAWGDEPFPCCRPGSGGVIGHGTGKHAVYRDEAGNLHECSAVCPHFGGIVHWNDMEKTWDCPIHGSRFAAADGRCVTSPARSGLAPVSGE